MYKSLDKTLVFLKYISLVFVFLKYMLQFNQYELLITNEKIQDYYNQTSAVQQLVGIEETYVPLKLLSLALVMVLSSIMLKYLDYGYIRDILGEEDKDWNRYYFLESKNKTKCKLFMHKVTIYTLFFLYHLFILLPLTIVVVISLTGLSIIGSLFLISTIIIMYK